MIPSVIYTECDEDVTIGHLVTYSYVTTVIFVIPMFLHAYCHVRILVDVSRGSLERKRSEGSFRTLRWRRHREKQSLTRLVVIIVLVFFVCRAPLEAFLLWRVVTHYNTGAPVEERTALIVHLACKTLAYITGVINPFLYAFCSPSFRLVFKKMLPETCRKNTSTSTMYTLPRFNSQKRVSN